MILYCVNIYWVEKDFVLCCPTRLDRGDGYVPFQDI